jgi:hypothetical protein
MRLILGLAAVLAVVAIAPAAASAAETCPSPCTVTTTSDDTTDNGEVSLREAIGIANTDGTDSTIVVPAGDYSLSSQLEVGNDGTLTITGAGARTTTLDPHGTSRVMEIDINAVVTMTGVTITGGAASGAGQSGGGLLVRGELELADSTVRDNTACENGGGIAVVGVTANLGLARSTVSDNRSSPDDNCGIAPDGGGIYNSGSTTLDNSTVSGNQAGNGSAAGNGGGIANFRTLQLRWATLVDNKAAGDGGNVYGGAASAEDLLSGGDPNNCANGDLTGAASGHDFSLSSDGTCSTDASRKNLDLKLGPLLDNGGPTDTHAPLAGSPAIDPPDNGTGDVFCPDAFPFPDEDQRSVARPMGHCDIGAYELVNTANLGVTVSGAPDPVAAGANVTYTVTVTSTGPTGDATQPTVTFTPPAGFVSATPSQGSCTGSAPVSCALGTVANGSNATIAVVVTAPASGPIALTASVTAPRPDTNAGDDSASASVAVTPAAPGGGGGGSGGSGPPGGGGGGPPVGGGGPPGGGPGPSAQVAKLTKLKVSPSRFRALGSGTSIAPHGGAKVTYTLSKAGTVTFTVLKKTTGRRVGTTCRRPTKKNRKRKHCPLYVRVTGSFTHAGKQGANSFRFSGRLKGRKLAPGSYRLAAKPAGSKVTTVAGFVIHR